MSTEYDKKEFWKSLEGYNNESNIDEIKKNEFLEGVTEDFDPDKLSGMSRRKFLAVLGASTAFAATACSDYYDKGEIVPYTKRPEEVLPGTANYYASTCTGCSNSCSTLVKTREGRPIKVDGNPDSPINKGKLCTKGQSSLLNLYDPERLKEPLMNGRVTDWITIDQNISNAIETASDNNKQLAIITGHVTSPTYNKLLDEYSNKFSNIKIYSHSQFNNNNRVKSQLECYGSSRIPNVKWDKAKVILSLESDFIGKEGNFVENTRLFADSRDVIKNNDMSRLYVAEGGMSLTGMNADYRLRVKPDQQYEFVMALLNRLSRSLSSSVLTGGIKNEIAKYNLEEFAKKNSLNEKTVEYLVNDLLESPKESVVYAGDSLSVDLHNAVNLLNELFDNKELFDFDNASTQIRTIDDSEKFEELVKDIDSSIVDVVIFSDNDVLYALPEDLKLKEALQKVNTRIALVESQNDTSRVCNYVLPINHALESWGDHQVQTNVVSLQQPVIAPIFKTRQKEAILLSWLNGADSNNEDIYHNYLQESFKSQVYDKSGAVSDFRTFWLSALHDGVVNLKSDKVNERFTLSNLKTVDSNDGISLHIQESYFVGDGRFANNGWLQEIPHPVTKVTWDNYAAIAPATAKNLGLDNYDVVKIDNQSASIEIPVLVQPGIAENHLTVETGYGRNVVGDVGKNVGFNINKLLSIRNELQNHLGSVTVSKTGKTHKLVTTQEHHSLDDTFVKDFHKIRNIVKEGTLEEYKNHPEFLHEHSHELFSITSEREYKGNKWAMAIDLNKCISCSACVASCNVENNVPVVGKEQVGKGREMHWMRIDRYYSGTPEEPIPSNQPMLCQHCDNAPCENVCPVNATNHSPDGLNQMAYNRCVGTRYCANNCPYKVRRFNFFDFRDNFEDEYYQNELTELVNNPEVTVRSRGVMEKCTFCVQRIMDARSEAIKEGREVGADEVVTACQQACPSEAIVFGDANDPNSKVSKMRAHNLGYSVLEELNVKPNVTYLAKLRNTHSEES